MRISLILIVLLKIYFCFAFDHDVKLSCPPEAKECELDWEVSYLQTMVLFNWTKFMGDPVNYKNGTYCKRYFDECDTNPSLCIPITNEELERVTTVDGSYHMIYAINNMFPGPSIVVYEHQIVKVRVKNKLHKEGISIHWHGMYQINTPWMDGVAMISQCPILPGQSFTYRFSAFPPGTHWYHSHVGTQRSDGLAGALIVLPRMKREDLPPLHNDFIFLVQDWLRYKSASKIVKLQEWYMLRYTRSYDDDTCFVSTKAHDGSLTGTHPFDGGLINGKGQAAKEIKTHISNDLLPIEIFNVARGKYYRFRMINTANLYPFRISVDNHSIAVVSSDGYDVEIQQAQSIMISPGETYDIILYTNATPGNYWIRAQTLDVLEEDSSPKTNLFEVLAVLHYEEEHYKRPTSKIQDCKGTESCTVVNCPYTTSSISVLEPNSRCLPITELKATEHMLKQHPVAIPKDTQDFQEIFLNFHFNSDGIRYERAAVNEFQFRFPSSPLQLYPDVSKAIIDCSTLKEGDPPLCTHTVKLKKNIATQITISNNDGIVSGMTHPVHLHGTHFHVLKQGFPLYDESGLTYGYNRDLNYSNHFTKQDWKNMSWNYGNVPGTNIINPPIKDTVTVPRRGYVVIRFRASNPGYWLMHCHVENHQLIGMAVLIQIGEPRDMVPTPLGIPQCGNFDWKPSQVSNQHYSKVSHKVKCLAENSDYVFIHQLWIVLLVCIGISLVCACVALGIYIVIRHKKYGSYQYVPFSEGSGNQLSEDSPLFQ